MLPNGMRVYTIFIRVLFLFIFSERFHISNFNVCEKEQIMEDIQKLNIRILLHYVIMGLPGDTKIFVKLFQINFFNTNNYKPNLF